MGKGAAGDPPPAELCPSLTALQVERTNANRPRYIAVDRNTISVDTEFVLGIAKNDAAERQVCNCFQHSGSPRKKRMTSWSGESMNWLTFMKARLMMEM